MSNIALETKTKEHEVLKAYLEENASDILAEKINNGVKIQKDGKILINKKTLEGFMTFATEEAKKFAEKGARSAMVEDKVVFGWLIHYFEEDSIEGILYNEDGSEYKKPVPVKKNTPKPEIKIEAKPPEKKVGEVISMFEGLEDIFATPKNDDNNSEIIEKNIHEKSVNPFADMKFNILAFPNADSYCFEYDNVIMFAGPATNTGIIRKHTFAYDFDLSADENIQKFYDYILQQEPELAIPFEEENGNPIKLEEKPKPTLYDTYMEVQSRYPDHIVMKRMGDFYEVFGDNATLLGNELNMTITSRELGNGHRFAMIGFPFHSLDAYINRILKNYSIVIIENGEEIVRNKIEPVKIENEGIVVDKKTGEVVDEELPYSIEHVAILAEIFGMENLEGC